MGVVGNRHLYLYNVMNIIHNSHLYLYNRYCSIRPHTDDLNVLANGLACYMLVFVFTSQQLKCSLSARGTRGHNEVWSAFKFVCSRII
jgi:hypothetical protein